MGLCALGLLDGDDTLLVDLAHSLGDELTDIVVVVCRYRSHLLDLGDVVADLLTLLAELGHNSRHGLVDTALQIHRVSTCGDVLQTYTDNGLCQYGCGGRTVAGVVVGLRGNLLDHLRAHVCKRILKLNLLGYGYTVLGHLRSAELLVDNDVASLGAESYLHGVAQRVDTLL